MAELPEQSDSEQGPRCVTGSLAQSRCGICFRLRPDVTQIQVAQPPGARLTAISTWACGECRRKIAYLEGWEDSSS